MGLAQEKWIEEINALSFDEKQAFYEMFSGFCSDNKCSLFQKLIHNRTYHLTVVLENIFQPQNASAVLRTCECLGVQDVHIIENEFAYQVNPDVALGATKWINLHRYNEDLNNTEAVYRKLKEQGYRIVATLPHKDDVLLEDLDISEKTALVFGTEKDGLSDYAIEYADAYVKIPMYGFTESFNISVSAAICLFYLTEKMRKSNINWQLTEDEKIMLKTYWARNVVHNSERVFEETLKRFKENA